MDYHVGSLACIIQQKTRSKISNTKLFENISSDFTKEVHFRTIPVNKRKRITEGESPIKKKKIKADEIESDIVQPKVKKARQINAENAEIRLKGFEVKAKERVINPDEDKRTVFVGNLPCNIKLTKLKKIFKPYGEIESARLRCPPVSDPRIPKKVAAIKKNFHPERTNIVGYVRFASEEEARDALQANGMLFRDHHLRVDLSARSENHDQKKAIFVGNVHFGAEENDIWRVFESCGPIESIRIVRDSKTGVGKGFSYVNFKDLSSVELALQLDGHELKDRPLRITRAVKKVPQKRKEPRMRAGVRGKGFNGGSHTKREKGKKSFQRQRVNNEEAEGKTGGKVKRRKPRVNLKPSMGGGNINIKNNTKDESSFQGNKVEDRLTGKIKKKKISKAELKKKVLAFQLQLKKISDPNSTK